MISRPYDFSVDDFLIRMGLVGGWELGGDQRGSSGRDLGRGGRGFGCDSQPGVVHQGVVVVVRSCSSALHLLQC